METRHTIGKFTYVFRSLPTTEAIALIPLLVEAMDPARLKDAVESGGSAAEAIGAEILKAMGARPKRLARLAKLLANHCDVEMGEKCPPLGPMYELHFQGRLANLIAWLTMGVVTNFGPFSGTSTSDGQR